MKQMKLLNIKPYHKDHEYYDYNECKNTKNIAKNM